LTGVNDTRKQYIAVGIGQDDAHNVENFFAKKFENTHQSRAEKEQFHKKNKLKKSHDSVPLSATTVLLRQGFWIQPVPAVPEKHYFEWNITTAGERFVFIL
jgi:hypothetical protein